MKPARMMPILADVLWLKTNRTTVNPENTYKLTYREWKLKRAKDKAAAKKRGAK